MPAKEIPHLLVHTPKDNVGVVVIEGLKAGTDMLCVVTENDTSFRLTALDLYRPEAPLGFDVDEHRALCREWAARTDGLERGLAAKGFGFGGRQRERAYHDALRDLATPAMGHPPVIRIAAVDGDGAAAYARHRAALQALSGGA